MTNKPRQKGTTGETAAVRYLTEQGLIGVERRTLRGNRDCGDIAGIPDTVIEVKNASKMKIAEWVNEAAVEAFNDEASIFFVLAKPVGVGLTSVGSWYAITTGEVMIRLLKERAERRNAGD